MQNATNKASIVSNMKKS